MFLKKILAYFIAFLSLTELHAQTESLLASSTVLTDTTILAHPSAPQKDVSDIWRELFHKKPKAPAVEKKSYNAIIPSVGYTIATGFTAVATNNIVLFLDKNDRENRSSIYSQAVYSQYNQFSFISNSNIWLPKKRLNLLGDWRFYKFPTSTYGLGGKTQDKDEIKMDYKQIRIYQAGLTKLSNNLFVGVGYNLDYHWDISNSDSTFNVLRAPEIAASGSASKSISSGISVNLLFDNRETAKNGSYAYARFVQNLRVLGSNTNWQSLLLEGKQFFKLSENHNQILALWTYNWLTLDGNAPYLDMPSTGWDAFNNMGRGYAVGRFRARNLVYLESEYRITLSRNGLFGAVLFANAQSVTEPTSNRFERILPGVGTGFRLKLNKKTNNVLAIDYAFGRYGSRGFFFNFNEVF